ncbi:hypothetical protein BCR43DRAFT_107606 [Syncephalastrum racemosum]|uniref:Uncharacterized protein n=1 Tax=Syncephalastrum racemosum TaxID=13706 RepID=A0A1X2H1W0_SYNRA|nr:hypothetical protein BCR43DRAFT_107606 [Syncephalastrum racemosum]
MSRRFNATFARTSFLFFFYFFCHNSTIILRLKEMFFWGRGGRKTDQARRGVGQPGMVMTPCRSLSVDAPQIKRGKGRDAKAVPFLSLLCSPYIKQRIDPRIPSVGPLSASSPRNQSSHQITSFSFFSFLYYFLFFSSMLLYS